MSIGSEGELAEAIRDANGPLAISGGGTRGVNASGDGLSVAGLTGIHLYEPGALTMVAAAGTPLAEIEEALALEGQMLAFEPYDLAQVTGATGHGTIGGVFATNASGSRRVQVGGARDFLLGVRFVDGSGSVIKNGGRVMKNVTGYDLVKLMAGSHGTLGVMSEVSFKVLPKPEAVAQISLGGLDDAQAVKAMAAALGSPFDVSGAMHVPGGATAIRVEGFAGSVAYRAEKLATLLGEFGQVTTSDDGTAWAEMGRLAQFSGEGMSLWRVSVKPSDAPALVGRIAGRHAISHSLDWGGGRIWVGARDADIAALHGDLQREAAALQGHATLVHSPEPDIGPRFQQEAPAIARLSAGLRAKFDPRGILNKGLMG